MAGRYEILAEIASGGMATVYLGRLASAPGFERQVAIKKLHPHLERQKDFIEMFLDEARIAARIHHPNVVQTLEFGADENGHFLVMDYVEGPTLAKLLAKVVSTGDRIPTPISIRIALDALAGLHAAHELHDEQGRLMNVVHRDVSPQNILISVDGLARITDFGVARANERLAVTRTGQLKGKLSYMAPEQARGDTTDLRADVFAMGVILWECLTGRRLFRGKTDTEAETLTKVLYGEITKVSAVNPEVHPYLDAICARALERPLEARFASCAEFIEALDQAARQGIEIATSREVARYIEQVYGQEIAQRRATIRSLRPQGEGLIPGETTGVKSNPQLSSVSSASLSYEASTHSRAIPLVTERDTSARTNGLLLGAVGIAVVAALGAAAVAVWVATRPQVAPVVLPAASIVVVPAQSVVPPEPSVVVTASASASAEPPASAASSSPKSPPLLPVAPNTPKKPPGGEGLSSNPYRQ